ncbi:MAG TPA: hypothetical protein VIR57_12230 [Chloroflexota bacterium]
MGFRRELPAAAMGALAALVVVLLMWAGSGGFRTFDAALIGYAVGMIFAAAAGEARNAANAGFATYAPFRHPVVLAGMGTDTNSALVASVSNAGETAPSGRVDHTVRRVG